ncbi:MAG: hypothetical protein GY749_18105 [Desulfobacteraceae bacterium]|nr:hypothetical protein [Desulfobacteraceae bacterium]
MMESKLVPQNIPTRFRAVRADVNSYWTSKVHDSQMHGIITFDSHVDKNRMARAVRLSLDAEPVLGCRYVADAREQYWERLDDLDSIELCDLIETRDPDKEIVRFLTATIDACKEPQVKVRILRSETDTLCIKVNHVGIDAGGVKEYAYLLASIYQGVANNPMYRPEINLGSRSFGQVSRRFGFSDKLRIIREYFLDSKNHFLSRMYWTSPLVKGDLSDRTFIIRRIGSKQFCAVREYSRRYGASINDVMLAAYYRALFKLINPDMGVPLHLLTITDLRRYLPAEKGGAICILTGGVFFNIGQEIGTTIDDTVILVRNQMRSKDKYLGLANHIFAMFDAIPSSWATWINRQIRRLTLAVHHPPACTNMGDIDKEQLVFGSAKVTDAFVTAPILFPPILLLGISAFGESLTMSVGFCGTTDNKPVVESLLDCIESEMPL